VAKKVDCKIPLEKGSGAKKGKLLGKGTETAWIGTPLSLRQREKNEKGEKFVSGNWPKEGGKNWGRP